jgi:hypothetical protein
VRFFYRRVEGLPRLAWCLDFDPATGTARVDHGPWVETSERGFFEGAWAGPFEELGFDEARTFAGSGARLRGDELFVATPTDTTEGVYSIGGRGGRVVFSNSLPFLLAVSGEALDLDYLDYENDALSICDGLADYRREMPTASGNRFRLHLYANVRIAPDGSLEERPKAVPAGPLRSFADYAALLRGEVRALCENAASDRRIQKFRPTVFCSNGYDSPACAALAREAGSEDAVVFETKKDYLRSDSGAEIVRRLGYENVNELRELDYKNLDVADLFLGTGELGTSIYFSAAASILPGRILFSGVNGDNVWSTEERRVSTTLKRPSFYPDTARKEFRLVTGYVNFPPAFIGVMRHREIWKISTSEEMRPWSVASDYDRPIPRRIVEEKGIPRELFGFSKGGGCGTSLRFGTLGKLRGVMPTSSYGRFAAFYRRAARRRKWSARRLWRAAMYWGYVAHTVLLLKRWHPWPRQVEKRIRREYTCSPFAPSFLFPWGVASLQEKYYARAVSPRSAASGAPAKGSAA